MIITGCDTPEHCYVAVRLADATVQGKFSEAVGSCERGIVVARSAGVDGGQGTGDRGNAKAIVELERLAGEACRPEGLLPLIVVSCVRCPSCLLLLFR